jgi:tetratricopeptide (TPR) repeat protein
MTRQACLALAASMLFAGLALAQRSLSHDAAPPAGESAAPAAKPAAPAMPLYKGLGATHHPVATASPLAQKYFDQGLAFAYGFNHQEAERSFEQAAQIDPRMAMAYWGMALVLGPNYNLPQDQETAKKVHGALEQARQLEGGATPEERDLIEALTQRYGSNGIGGPALDQAYASAMRTVAHRYPDDLDVQTLFAESLMDLHPWQLWSIDGKPGPDTVEIVTTLETVLKKDPNHIGANHYYIHAVEASPDPARATPSAERLGMLAPAAGHLVHMPAHIYIRTGRFHDSSQTNVRAIKADQDFLAASKESGVYPLVYYTHNIHFLCYAQMMEGRGRESFKSARLLESKVPLQAVREMPMAEFLVPMPYFVEARFGQWDAILKEPAPPRDLPYTLAMWHYARGLAFSGKRNFKRAARERKELDTVIATIPPDRPLGTSNRAKDVAQLAAAVLAGEIAAAKGDHAGAAAGLARAVRMQDALVYEEPPIWYFPVRESLGAELMTAGRTQQAEAVYREDLRINPGNPRSLWGLGQCLRAEGNTQAATEVGKQFRRAWRYADSDPAPPQLAMRSSS